MKYFKTPVSFESVESYVWKGYIDVMTA